MSKFKLFGHDPDNTPAKPKQLPPRDPPLFDQLFACAFRGHQFPVVSMSVSVSHDNAEHKYYGVDLANIEETGRNSATFEAEIPFVNGITPGKNERWGVLYPTAFRQFLEDFYDPSTGILDTPEFAGLRVKPVSVEFKHDGQTRDGVFVTARWIETLDVSVPDNVQPSNIEAARLAALTLDAEYVPLEKDYQLPKVDSFENLVNELTGVVDTTASRLKLIANKPAQILYRVKKVQDSLERVGNPRVWPGRESAEKLEELAHELAKLPSQVDQAINGSPVGRYTAKGRMSVSQLALATQNSVDNIIKLNPSLASRPAVAAGTVVRYFKNGRVPSK